MTKAARLTGLVLLLLCLGFSIVVGRALERGAGRGFTVDFQALYYPTQCLLQHKDPYDLNQLHAFYVAEAARHPAGFLDHPEGIKLHVNLPTASVVLAPLALLPWNAAEAIWLFLLGGLLLAASLCMWSEAAGTTPALTLACIVLANCEVLFGGGNAAGVVTALCVLGAWCFLRQRLVWVGAACFAVSLAIKPHDAGLVWLYFLLSEGVRRRQALYALLMTAGLSAAAVTWVSQIAPRWYGEWRSIVAASAGPGGGNDPGPGPYGGVIIDLQAIIALFRNEPRFYNTVTYVVCGGLALAWVWITLKARFTRERAWLALAAIAPLTLIATYHRPYDAKLLLLTIPACCLLGREGGRTARIAVTLTTAGLLLTSDLPIAMLDVLAGSLHAGAGGPGSLLLTIALMRPAPLVLLAMSGFYLWVYRRRAMPDGAGESKAMLPKT